MANALRPDRPLYIAARVVRIAAQISLCTLAGFGIVTSIVSYLEFPPVTTLLDHNLGDIALCVMSAVLLYVVLERMQLDKAHQDLLAEHAGLKGQLEASHHDLLAEHAGLAVQLETARQSLQEAHTGIVKHLDEETERIIKALPGGPVEELENSSKLYERMADRISRARTRVLDLSWGPSRFEGRKSAEVLSYQKYVESKKLAIQNGVQYSEVWTFPDDDQHRRDSLKEIQELGMGNYEPKCYSDGCANDLPLLNFLIVDDEVITTYYSRRVVTAQDLHIATANPLMFELFRRYYEVIWILAAPIPDKTGS